MARSSTGTDITRFHTVAQAMVNPPRFEPVGISKPIGCKKRFTHLEDRVSVGELVQANITGLCDLRKKGAQDRHVRTVTEDGGLRYPVYLRPAFLILTVRIHSHEHDSLPEFFNAATEGFRG
jgi:hypothetical protein